MYATAEDLKMRLGERFAGIYGDNAEYPASDLATAEAEVNATIGVRYALPIVDATALTLLKSWSLTLAEELAYTRTAGSAKNERLDERVKQVRALLKEAVAGKIHLGEFVAETQPQNSIVFVETNVPQFTREKMRGF